MELTLEMELARAPCLTESMVRLLMRGHLVVSGAGANSARRLALELSAPKRAPVNAGAPKAGLLIRCSSNVALKSAGEPAGRAS